MGPVMAAAVQPFMEINTMQPKNIFRIIVATFGLYIIYTGFADLVAAVAYTLDVDEIKEAPFPQQVFPRFFAMRGVVEVVVGMLVTNGFIPLTNFAFPENEKSDENLTRQSSQPNSENFD